MNKNEMYNKTVQVISIAWGSILMWGISRGTTLSCYFVACLMVVFFWGEVFLLLRKKGYKHLYWSVESWILLISAIGFVLTSNDMVRLCMGLLMFINGYAFMYKECYYERISISYIMKMLCDLPFLWLGNMPNLFKPCKNTRYRIACKKVRNGVIILFVVLVFVMIPLFMVADPHILRVIQVLTMNFAEFFPVLALCVFLGLIPAMINYSIMRGLDEDIVLRNPRRNAITQISIPINDYYINETILKILLGGILIVNYIFMVFQCLYIYRINETHAELEYVYSMKGCFPLLFSVGLDLGFFVISQYYAMTFHKEKGLSQTMFIYIISVIGLIILVTFRYIKKVLATGITDYDILFVLGISIFSIVVLIGLRNVMLKRYKYLNRFIVGIIIIWTVMTILPRDYIISHINVSVFLKQYNERIYVNGIDKEAIDLEFLKAMRYDSIPAMTNLLDIQEEYDHSNKSMQKVTKEIILFIFSQDMSNEERDLVGELKTLEEFSYFKDIMGKKYAYSILGKRKVAYDAFCKKIEMLTLMNND